MSYYGYQYKQQYYIPAGATPCFPRQCQLKGVPCAPRATKGCRTLQSHQGCGGTHPGEGPSSPSSSSSSCCSPRSPCGQSGVKRCPQVCPAAPQVCPPPPKGCVPVPQVCLPPPQVCLPPPQVCPPAPLCQHSPYPYSYQWSNSYQYKCGHQ